MLKINMIHIQYINSMLAIIYLYYMHKKFVHI